MTESITASGQLLSHYQVIGHELVQYERSQTFFSNSREIAFQQFRSAVSFVQVEVLESYLDDLLDLEVNDEVLFIQQSEKRFKNVTLRTLQLLGFMAAMGLGIYAASCAVALHISFLLALAAAAPFFLVGFALPRPAARRLSLAKILSREISRRRGGREDDAAPIKRALEMKRWSSARASQPATGSSRSGTI